MQKLTKIDFSISTYIYQFYLFKIGTLLINYVTVIRILRQILIISASRIADNYMCIHIQMLQLHIQKDMRQFLIQHLFVQDHLFASCSIFPTGHSNGEEIRSSPFITCSAIHSTILSSIPLSHAPFRHPFHFPSAKKGVTQVKIKSSPFKITHEITMRLSHARNSSTSLPDLEKFIKSRETEVVTIVAIVELPSILQYTSFRIVFALDHISDASAWLD